MYPNPFNPAQAVNGVLKFDNLQPNAEIRIFTLTGELIRTIIAMSSRETWDGTNKQGSDVVAGVYLYVIISGSGEKSIGKIFLIK